MKFSALISGELTENSLYMLNHHATRNAMIRKLWRDITVEDSNMFLQFQASIRSLIWEGEKVTLREFPANSTLSVGFAMTSDSLKAFGLIRQRGEASCKFALDRFVNHLYNTIGVEYVVETQEITDDMCETLRHDPAAKSQPWGLFNNVRGEYNAVEFA